MTKISNDPADFSGEALSGFAGAFPKYVQQVPGGLVRAGPPTPGKVAVVIGGGTGHYPAFAGWVGPGMADGAVVGDVFASPSAQQIVSVALAADAGGGIFLSYGNYAGDVLNFNAARDQLIAAGVPARSVVVTDDLASAPPEDRPLRRGTAGDLIVIKVAAAAAEAGYDLDGVAAVADMVNKRTASLSVAFSGCTPPGSAAPLFTLAPGQMAVGLGLHGEAGISEQPILGAADLATFLSNASSSNAPKMPRRQPFSSTAWAPPATKSSSSSGTKSPPAWKPQGWRSSIPKSANSSPASTWPASR